MTLATPLFDFALYRKPSRLIPRLCNCLTARRTRIYLPLSEIPGPRQKAGAAHELKPLSLPPVTSGNLRDPVFAPGSLGLTRNKPGESQSPLYSLQQRFFAVQAKNNNNSSSSSSQNKGKSLEPKKTSTPDLSLKLRKDRKLTPQEWQRHLNKNLCLFCGAPDHRAADCNKAVAAAKACTSKTTPTTTESTSKHCCLEVKKD